MDPDFSLLRGCNLDDALFREMADFIVRYAVGPNADIQIDHSRKVVVRTQKTSPSVKSDRHEPHYGAAADRWGGDSYRGISAGEVVGA